MKKILLLTLGFLAFSILQAQDNSTEITSTITDENGEPIMGVNIVALKEGKYSAGVVSDLEGQFSIVANADSYVFSYIGFESETYSAEELKGEKFIVLETAVHEFQTIIVKATNPWLKGCGRSCGWRIERFKKRWPAPFKSPAITSWSVYPNPATEWVNIKSKMAKGNINIIAANGQVVTSKSINSYLTEINLNHLPNGAYYLQYVQKGEIEYVGTLIKANSK